MKSHLVQLLSNSQYEDIAALAGSHRRVLSWLTGLTYHPDPVIADRAVLAFGPAAMSIAADNPEYVRSHLRRLFWLVNDESGGIGWRAPELIGQAIAACPGEFDEFISPLAYLLDMEAEDVDRFRPGVLAALLGVARSQPEKLTFALPLIRECKFHPDPAVRDLAQALMNTILVAG